MAQEPLSRNQLLDQWRTIEQEQEEEDDDDDGRCSTDRLNRIQQAKETWFSAAYNFLICLPRNHHMWCRYWDLMTPFLETFFNYFKVEGDDSLLKILWERISREMRRCTECISRHHQAQEMYKAEYESSFISPLLSILQCLDEERVFQHLKEANIRLGFGGYNLAHDNDEIVSLMFEVLTFPVLLDDDSIVNEFQKLIEAVDDAHELALAKKQHFPGVYALLFFKSRKSRAIGHRLTGNLGKLRSAAELEPLQPLLKRCIGFLAGDVVELSLESSRPRVQMDRTTVWLGLKALLAFLEPSALEDGILEPHPVFLSFVLDHISDDSPEFSHAVICMRLLFEILGCKLWLRTSLPPSVMRDSLLSQCFHTRNEKIHKEIFDLFQPFLQSLEALHDGEFEKQRRHFLFFLLHQVTRSSNFSILMRKKACQIALLIVHRGYKMNPPSPPSECAHMWGPSLVSSLKDLTLHNSLRQPAIDLIQMIIVSDATALLSSLVHCQTSIVDCSVSFELIEEPDDVNSCSVLSEEKDVCCWNKFTLQSNIVCQEYTEWMCVPMLWLDILVEIDSSVLPISIAKAVLWALARFSMVEPENSSELSLPVKTWVSSGAAEVAAYFGWKFPTGSDDCGDGKTSKNSVRVSTICIPLIRTFRRLAAHFIIQVEQGELRKQWTWEPEMGESLILLLSDPNDNVRQVGRRILEYVSHTRGLASGLQFLCSSRSSLTAIHLGLKHALKLVQLDSVLVNFQSLHHFFFVLCKIFKEGFPPHTYPAGNSPDVLSSKFASQGGFLQQTALNSLHVNDSKQLSRVEKKWWESFIFELAEAAWTPVKKCVYKGKDFMDYRVSQMSCVRLLEILPILFEELIHTPDESFDKSLKKIDVLSDLSWLQNLVDWGKSSLDAVVRYWKQSLRSLLALLKSSCNESSGVTVTAIEKLIASDVVPMNSLTEQVLHLSVSLSERDSCVNRYNQISKPSSDGLAAANKGLSINVESPLQFLDTLVTRSKKNNEAVILSSDDESEILESPVIVRNDTSQARDVLAPTAHKAVMQSEIDKKNSESSTAGKFTVAFEKRIYSRDTTPIQKSKKSAVAKHASTSTSLTKIKGLEIGEKDVKSTPEEHISSRNKATTKASSTEAVISKQSTIVHDKIAPDSSDAILKEIVRDAEDPLELALKSAGRNHSVLKRQSSSLPKRRVIQLADPVDSRSEYLRKQEAAARRFKPPKMDDWFRPILEMDYFEAVGLDSAHEEEYKNPIGLKEVPVSFESPQQYVNIFRPLVLEEFKAQLRSSFQEVSSFEEMSCGSLSVVSVERIDDFHLVRCVHDEHGSSTSSSCLENDLVLLSKQPSKNSSHNIHMVGKVERREKDNKRRLNMLLIRFYLQNGCSRLNRARKQLLARSKWYLSRIMSITPQLREFQALSSIEVIPALPVILRPANHWNSSQYRKVDLSKLSQPMQQVLKSTFNDSQIQAISAVVETPDSRNDFDLSLVQGPPGTGKTRTIVALISALLAVSLQSNALKKHYGETFKVKSTPFTNFKKRISESAAIARAWQDAAYARQLNDNVGNDSKTPKTSMRKRVLVCAQSNAAVDELVSRLCGEGLYGADGNMYKPYLVRVGNAKTVHPNSLPFFIDTLVETRLAEKTNLGDGKDELNGESSAMLHENLEKIVDSIKFFESKRADLKDEGTNKNGASVDEKVEGDKGKKLSDSELEARLRSLYRQKKDIYMRLAALQAREKKIGEEIRGLRNELRRSILREAEIVVTTLSGCGGDLYSACFESVSNCKSRNLSEHNLFDAVVIDEAAQALEPATLIPFQLLKTCGTKCIMVGDPKQLPATVLSNVASRYLYECSMFERLQRANYPVIMLTKQYRMHPEISRFPSLHFYDGKLLNGVMSSSKTAPFHETSGLGPYVFYDISDGQEQYGKNAGSSSLHNEGEADAAIEIVRFLQKRYSSEFVGGRIGIITPYKSQLSLLRSKFSRIFGSSISSEMEFNTVDGFQGREVDILILSTVRSSDINSVSRKMNSSSIGFVADIRRMNVALTRARLSLWILGNARTLQNNTDWADLLKDARERNLVISVKRPYKSICENLLGKSSFTKNSSDCRVLGNEVRKSQHAMQIESNNETARKKGKHKEVQHRHDNTSAREGLETTRRKADATEKYKFQVEQQLNSEDMHKLGKKIKKRSAVQYNQEDGGIDKSSDPLCSSEDAHRNGKTVQTRDLHQISHTQGSKKLGNPVQLLKNEKRKSDLGSPSNSKVKSKDTDGRGQPSSDIQKPKDLKSKRKQQREAVDALLSSALLPSKKPETSGRTTDHKRPLSPSSKGGVCEPTKQRRGQQAEKQEQKKDRSAESLSSRKKK